GVAVYTRWLEPHWIEVVRRELPIARLPEVLAGKTLVHISDLHIGPVVDEGYISRALQQVSALEADILVVTGDFMTYDSDEQIEQTARVLRHLRPGRLATLGVLGNHAYGPHWSDETVADRLSARLRGAGIDLLQNAKRDVFGLEIAGIDDLWSPRFKPDDVLRSL